MHNSAMSANAPGDPTLAALAPPLRRVLVRPERRWRLPDLGAVWQYRELFWVLALRDIKVRYKQTVLGVAWAIVQPLGAMIVFTTISHFARIATDGVRPEVFYYCGLCAWLLFANAMSSAGNSLLGSQHLVTKVYFPRLILPVASVVTAVLDFTIAFVVLLALMLFYGVAPGPGIALLPLFVGLACATALAFGLWLSALSTQFRDVRHMAPFVTQLWLFCTPVLYPSSAVGGGWKRVLLDLNPMSAIVDGFRWCVLGRSPPAARTLVFAVVTIAVVLGSALYYFQRVERALADRI
jgi:lipopolysaccharide transport system permease protein